MVAGSSPTRAARPLSWCLRSKTLVGTDETANRPPFRRLAVSRSVSPDFFPVAPHATVLTESSP